MLGEYVQTGKDVEVKLYKEGAVFTYIMEISKSDSNSKTTDALLVKLYHLKVLD